MNTRYKPELHTPGKPGPGKPEIVRDPLDGANYDAVQIRRRELAARLSAVNAELNSLTDGLGAWVAEGCDHRQYTDRLAELRAEVEGLQAGIQYLEKRAAIILRGATWIRK